MTELVAGSKTGGERVGEFVLGQPCDLLEHLAGGVCVDVGEWAVSEHVLATQDLEEVEFDVAQVGLVVTHGGSSERRCLTGC